jgi:hypothetical protein
MPTIEHLTDSVGPSRVRAALKRLAKACMPVVLLAARRPDVRSFVDLLSATATAEVTNHRRRVPVPRRMLRFLARCSRPAITAVVFGHLLRGMYYRSGQCVAGGTCKASWISTVFGLDLRTVKSARKVLVSLGWLMPLPTPQHLLNRFGPRFLIDMRWRAPARRQTPPRDARSAPQSPPPEKNGNLSLRRT